MANLTLQEIDELLKNHDRDDDSLSCGVCHGTGRFHMQVCFNCKGKKPRAYTSRMGMRI